MIAPLEPPLGASVASEERVDCEHAGTCGGCPWIDHPYGEQLARKRARVVRALGRYAALELLYAEPVAPADPRVGYRTRAKLIAAPGGKIGLYTKAGGHVVVDIPHCRVLSPALARVGAVLRAHIAASECEGGPLTPTGPAGGHLRAIDLREVQDRDALGVLVTFVVEQTPDADLAPLRTAAKALMKASSEVLGVAANLHSGDTPQVLGVQTIPLLGATTAPDRIGRSVHFATYGSFVQTHRGQAARVHQMVADALGLPHPPGHKPHVLDLYGGSGAIALGLAGAGARVCLIESFAPAAEQARQAAASQSLDVHVECADVAAALRTKAEERTAFDAAVVNPPRRGASPAAREGLARVAPSIIAYVSCDPDTLSRDLDHFARLGYLASSISPVDMIPLTEEVETVAILHRGAPALPRVLHENDEIVVVEKGPHEPTMPQGEYMTSLLARARNLPGLREAVPVHRLDVSTSGIVVLARRADKVGKWAAIVSDPSARLIYLAGVRGVTPGKGAIVRTLREDGKPVPARTRYRRLAIVSGQSVVRVVADQDHLHQIRRHFAAVGHPLLGDDRYGHAPTNRYFEERNGLDRAFLHCVRLEYTDPSSGARHVVEAPLPGDLRGVLERVSGAGTLRFLEHKNALGGTLSSMPPPLEAAPAAPDLRRSSDAGALLELAPSDDDT